MKKRMISLILACAFILGLCGCEGNVSSDEVVADAQKDNETYEEFPDWEMNVREEELVVEGLTQEYRFLFLTDTHMVVQSESDSDEVKEYAAQRVVEFCNEESVASAYQFEEWVKYANREAVDSVLLGGDMIDFPSEANVEHLADNLDKLDVPYLYTPGNHDWTFPWEYMTQIAKESYLPMLAPYMRENPFVHYFETEEFIVVAVDNSSNQIAPEALEGYKQILQKGKPVVVLLHVPLLTQSVLTKAKEVWSSAVVLGGGNYGGIYPNDISTEFINVTTAEDSPVVAVLAGHVHYYDRDMVNDNIVQIVGDAGFKGKGILLKMVPASE